MGELFDIAEARGALMRRRESLIAECKACHQVRRNSFVFERHRLDARGRLSLEFFVGCWSAIGFFGKVGSKSGALRQSCPYSDAFLRGEFRR